MGDVLKLGRHCVKSRSVAPEVVALPTGGAELCRVAKGREALSGAISMMRD